MKCQFSETKSRENKRYLRYHDHVLQYELLGHEI